MVYQHSTTVLGVDAEQDEIVFVTDTYTSLSFQPIERKLFNADANTLCSCN